MLLLIAILVLINIDACIRAEKNILNKGFCKQASAGTV